MRILSSLNASFLAGLMATTPYATADEPPIIPAPSAHPLSRMSFTAGMTTGCDKLYDDTCGGTSKRLEWRGPETSWGTTRIGVEGYQESMGRTFFERNFSNSVAEGGISLDWGAKIKGTRLTIDQEFRLGRNAAVEIGAFIGRVSADAEANGTADLTVFPRTITTPPFNVAGYQVPSYSYQYKGDEWSRHYGWEKHGKSPDGGIHARAAWAVGLTPLVRVGVNGFGAASLARISYGMGASLYYSSSFDNRLGTSPGGECSGQPLRSSARFAFAIGACVSKIKSDRIIDAEMDYAGRLARKANAKTEQWDQRLDQVRDHLPDAVDLPSIATQVTAHDIAKVMGFRSDYQRAQAGIVVSASVRVGESATISLSHLQTKDDGRTTVALGWSFK